MKIRQTKINKLDENESKYNIQLPVLANINRRVILVYKTIINFS